MKKSRIYIISIIVFVVAVVAIIFNYNRKEKEKEERVYSLLPRKGAAANSAEWKEVQKRANVLLEALRQDPNDLNSNLRIAALYIQEARETGNYMYYDQAAMKSVNNVLKND